MMYHKNRLIKAYERVGCQLKNKAVGIVGVVECNFLKPTHNKQDFDYTDDHKRTMEALGRKLSEYWEEMKQKKSSNPLNLPVEDIEKKPDQTWVQCDFCLKWRKLPDGVTISERDYWCCSMNMDPRFRKCSVPEEPEDDDITQPTYKKTPKKSLQSAVNWNPPAKKQKLTGSGPTDLLQQSNNDNDVIVIEDNDTNSCPAAPENMNHELHVNKKDASNDYNDQENQQMPGSSSLYRDGIAQLEMDIAHKTQLQESSKDTTGQEKEKQISELTNKYIEINGLAAQCEVPQNLETEAGIGLQNTAEDSSEMDYMALQLDDIFRQLVECTTERDKYKSQITELRNQVMKEVSHKETQTDIIPPNTVELSLELLAAKYEQALKEINKLKAQCEVLQDLKAESGTGPQKPAKP
ncbi:hypothetical protein XENTR_v10004853 [Xenopus tropicalis]|nr:hypothetical protein XENTR_v10004853 [Xenopus tropicalis]|eukprot:XP_017947274.1 PREDICTED: MORC family CW-type zinc finger protein 3-like [Xenopus tropicalis]